MSKTVVANTNLATAPANSVKANTSGSAGQPTDLSVGTLQFVGNAGTGLAAITLSAGGGIVLNSQTTNTIVLSTSPADVVNSMLVGMVAAFAMNSAPVGWLQCNGDTIPNGNGTVQGKTANFSALYALLGSTHGTLGQLPDLRGYFVRGAGTNSDGTGSGTFGAKQADDLKSHTHTFNQAWVGGGGTFASRDPNQYNLNQTSTTTGATGGTETRPKNIPMLYCIKY